MVTTATHGLYSSMLPTKLSVSVTTVSSLVPRPILSLGTSVIKLKLKQMNYTNDGIIKTDVFLYVSLIC